MIGTDTPLRVTRKECGTTHPCPQQYSLTTRIWRLSTELQLFITYSLNPKEIMYTFTLLN